MRGSWRPNRTAIYWPLLLWPWALCLSRSLGLLNRRPGGSLCWMLAFLYHILSLTHLISDSIGGPEGSFCWVVAFPTTSSLQLPDFLSPPSYIIVQWPTQSLEWHVCSSSSGNNCHAVHRSLSSGASVYKCTMGFLPCPIFFSQTRLRDFFSELPSEWVTSFRCITLEWHVWSGRQVNIANTLIFAWNAFLEFLNSIFWIRPNKKYGERESHLQGGKIKLSP